MTNAVNVCHKEKIVIKKENVDYENMNEKEDVNEKSIHQLQSKGM